MSKKSSVETTRNPSLAQYVRHDVISTAVSFLLNPQVKGRSHEEKRHFLLHKGLTFPEIDLAMESANQGLPYSVMMMKQQQSSGHNHNLSLLPSSHQHYPPSGPTHFHHNVHYDYPGAFVMTRALIPSIAVASSFLYGLYLLWKKYLEPRIFGHQKHPLVLIQENLMKLQETVELLNSTMKQLEVNIVDQLKKEIESNARPSPQERAETESLKKELASIKSLLLGRKQFPEAPIPSHQASIPSWQLTDEAKDRQ